MIKCALKPSTGLRKAYQRRVRITYLELHHRINLFRMFYVKLGHIVIPSKIKIVNNSACCTQSGLPAEVWAAKTFDLFIVVVTGAVKHGVRATETYGKTSSNPVWVLLRPSYDGSGKAAPHFDWIAKARNEDYFIPPLT